MNTSLDQNTSIKKYKYESRTHSSHKQRREQDNE